MDLSLSITADLGHRGVGRPEDLTFPPTTFAAFGGRPLVAQLVEGLYDRIEGDSVLRDAFARSLDHEREAQKQFFEAWFGGEQEYLESDWHPGLRARHTHLFLSPGIAERWLTHFRASLAEIQADPALKTEIERNTSRLAAMLINREDEPQPGQHLRCCGSGRDALPFVEAVRRNDGDTLDRLAGVEPPFIPAHGASLLLSAAVRGKSAAAEALLRNGAPVNMPAVLSGSASATHRLPTLPFTPLCAALAKRRAATVHVLQEHGAVYDVFTAALLGDL